MTDDELGALDIDARIDARLDRLGEQIRQVVAERDALAAEVERLRSDLEKAAAVMRRVRGALRSGQYHDKDVDGTLGREAEGITAALQEPPA